MQPERPEGENCPPWTGESDGGTDGKAEPASPAGQRTTRLRLGLTVAVLILALCGLAGSVVGIVNQFLPRSFTAAQQRQIMAWEMARRWRTTPAGKMFPTAVTYHVPGFALNSATDLALTAHRLGIGRQEGCAAATDQAAARILDPLGCTAVLRATYADSTGSMVVTVGVAVLPDMAAASAAMRDFSAAGGSRADSQTQPGLRPTAFADTLAAGFGTVQRQLFGDASDGPYLILSAAGFADGRPRVAMSSDAYADQEMSSFADGVAGAVGAPLSVRPPVPRCPGAPGC